MSALQKDVESQIYLSSLVQVWTSNVFLFKLLKKTKTNKVCTSTHTLGSQFSACLAQLHDAAQVVGNININRASQVEWLHDPSIVQIYFHSSVIVVQKVVQVCFIIVDIIALNVPSKIVRIHCNEKKLC